MACGPLLVAAAAFLLGTYFFSSSQRFVVWWKLLIPSLKIAIESVGSWYLKYGPVIPLLATITYVRLSSARVYQRFIITHHTWLRALVYQTNCLAIHYFMCGGKGATTIQMWFPRILLEIWCSLFFLRNFAFNSLTVCTQKTGLFGLFYLPVGAMTIIGVWAIVFFKLLVYLNNKRVVFF